MKKRILATTLVIIVLGVFLKTNLWVDHPEKRGDLVVAAIREQRDLFRRQPPLKRPSLAQLNAADRALLLEKWIVGESLRGRSPGSLLGETLTLLNSVPAASQANLSPEPWLRRLQEWEQFDSTRADLRPEQWVEQGAQRLFEGIGYTKVGEKLEGTIYDLWAIETLTHFLDQNPRSSRVPEAIYLLGTAYLELDGLFPMKLREDRVINLVSEYFPETFWANQANAVWNRRRGQDG